jgi:hypothetical protein
MRYSKRLKNIAMPTEVFVGVYVTKSNKRSKAKYPALKKELNLKSREDYIEPDYVNGVRDESGKMVIRPLTNEEKEFLNDFYAETIITDFLHDPDLKILWNKKKSLINNNHVNEIKKQIKELREESPVKNKARINELKKIVRLTKQQNAEIFREKIEEIERQMQEIREENLLYPDKEDHKQFYGANNARNNCLYNKLKSMKQIINYDPEYDNIFCSIKNNMFDNGKDNYEDKLIDELEREDYEEEEERLKEVLKQEKLKK